MTFIQFWALRRSAKNDDSDLYENKIQGKHGESYKHHTVIFKV